MSVLCQCKVTCGAVCKPSTELDCKNRSTKSNPNTVGKQFTVSAGNKVYCQKQGEKLFDNKLKEHVLLAPTWLCASVGVCCL